MQSLRASTSQLAACAACALPSTSRRAFTSSAPSLHSTIPRPARKIQPNKVVKILKTPRVLPAGTPQTELFTALTSTPAVRARSSLINEDSAQAIVKGWGVDQMEDVTVVDTYAGAPSSLVECAFLRSTLTLPLSTRPQDREA